LIVSNARSKPLDPSLPPVAGGIPTTAKMGIDATIPENVPRSRYNRIVYFNQADAKLVDYMGVGESDGGRPGKVKPAGSVDSTAERIVSTLAKAPCFFAELLKLYPQIEFRMVAEAVGVLYQRGAIGQDSDGKYQLKENP
jgi:2,5-furandicarboxylate decarboxylase 1